MTEKKTVITTFVLYPSPTNYEFLKKCKRLYNYSEPEKPDLSKNTNDIQAIWKKISKPFGEKI